MQRRGFRDGRGLYGTQEDNRAQTVGIATLASGTPAVYHGRSLAAHGFFLFGAPILTRVTSRPGARPVVPDDAFEFENVSANPYASPNPSQSGAEADAASPAGGAFSAPGWQRVREGLIVVYTGYLAAVLATVAIVVLALSAPTVAVAGALFVALAGLAILVGTWMCCGVPANSELRGSITFASLALTYQWLCVVVLQADRWLHFGRGGLALVRLTDSGAQFIAIGCFLWFLIGLARRARDNGLVARGNWLLGSFVAFYSIALLSRIITFGATGHLTHRAHLAHHLRPLGGLFLVFVGLALMVGVIVWFCAYISLIKSLADKIESAGERGE